jgi:hypothetical protein
MMKLLGYVRLAGLVLTAAFGSGEVSVAQSGVEYSYVANTAPPDAFLALHIDPSSNSPRIMAMANGTKLEVLRRRVDGWWFVKVAPTGEQGWAFSGHGDKAWILCCVAANENKSTNGSVVDKLEADSNTGPPPDVYTPILGSQERASIMDAIRLATNWTIKFKVDHLIVARRGSKAIAVADVSDASRRYDNSGVFQLEGLNGQWRALYSVGGGGGASDCKTERTILTKMKDKNRDYLAPRDMFPVLFWKLNRDNNGNNENSTGSADCMIAESFVEKIN